VSPTDPPFSVTADAFGPAPVPAEKTSARPPRRSIPLAWLGLAVVDLALRLLGFPRVHRAFERLGTHRARRASTRSAAGDAGGSPTHQEDRARRLAAAVDRAAAHYPGRAWCLERSLVTAALLRLRGLPATLVIGVRRGPPQTPIQAHAWVELDGQVINDAPEIRSRWAVLYED